MSFKENKGGIVKKERKALVTREIFVHNIMIKRYYDILIVFLYTDSYWPRYFLEKIAI